MDSILIRHRQPKDGREVPDADIFSHLTQIRIYAVDGRSPQDLTDTMVRHAIVHEFSGFRECVQVAGAGRIDAQAVELIPDR
ncbi:MAG: hypothetical protein ACRDIC_15735 [bacterium]